MPDRNLSLGQGSAAVTWSQFIASHHRRKRGKRDRRISLELEPRPFCRFPMSLSGSSDATSTSSRKRPVVYVDIPSSTLHLSLENRRHSLQKMSKRKGVAQAPLSSRELNRTEVSATSSESGVAKKRKISSGKSAKIPYVLIEEKKIRKPAYDPEFPNGFFYCHQCNKKRAKDGLSSFIFNIFLLNISHSGIAVHCQ